MVGDCPGDVGPHCHWRRGPRFTSEPQSAPPGAARRLGTLREGPLLLLQGSPAPRLQGWCSLDWSF